ncbi:MAG: hypothetical protein IH571_00330, partial [Acholeplasmataceae bacterium]|nr:hypothetical protein [Acholeplasmataceae bacterium]
NREIKNLFFDSYGRIDGLTQAKFRPVLFKSATLSEVRDLGSKYGVEVPRRLKKSELADIIIKELTDRKQHTNILEQEIRGMSVLVMQRFAIDHDIKASTELKKEEIIEYILANAKETKEAYFVPDSKEVYEKEVSEVAEQPIEDIEPEAPKEEQQPLDEIQEVTEVPSADDFIEQTETRVEDEKKVQYVQSNVDFSELISEVKRLREVVEDFINPNQAELKTEENVTDEEIDEARIIAEDTKPAVRDKVLLNVLNTAEFFGTTKDLKKAMRKEEVAEREAFVEDSKKHSGIGTGIEARINMAPAEARFFGRLFLNLGKALLKLLLKLLKLALILFIVALAIFILYAVITKLVEIPFLVDFNDTLNGLQIAGKGILDHCHDFLGALGL